MCECKHCGFWSPCELGRSCPNDECEGCRGTAGDMIEQFCVDLNAAHDEILRLQGVAPDNWMDFDWPQWSAPANSIRWAERYLNKPLSKTNLRSLRKAG
jgi:hypothetical protein